MGRRQLLAAGVSRAGLASRLRNGRLVALHPGVYAAGHAQLRDEGRWLAAVLACGPNAVLSHRSAAALHGLRPAGRARIDVSTPTHRRSTELIAVHARRRLDAVDRMCIAGVPVTTVARTLVDLASAVPPDQLRRALRRAEDRGTLDLGAIDAALRRTRGRRGGGHALLRAALDELAAHDGQVVRSPLEERFLALVAQADLPRPRTNVWFPGEGFEVDALWRAERVAVELDGWAHHRTRDAFQRDRRKANVLTLHGWAVLRFTHADVVRRPSTVVAQVRAALVAGRASSRAG